MKTATLPRAATQALAGIGADAIASGRPRAELLTARTSTGFTETAAAILDAAVADEASPQEAAAYLHGLAAGYELRTREQDVSLVWSGPSSHRVPVRSTARVLLQLVAEVRTELILMTYSARRYAPLEEALRSAIARGVVVDIVVETLQGAGNALTGAEPASAFADVAGIRLWHWPSGRRTEQGAKTHAKLLVADRRTLLTTSANFTHSGVDRNIEAGVLITGGSTPARAVEHVRELQRQGVLERYW